MNVSERITRWFHTPEYDHVSPYQTVVAAVAIFVAELRTRGLVVSVSYKIFHDAMCELVCRLYMIHLRNTRGWISNPRRTFPKPPKWNDQIESIWQMYCIEQFGDVFWTKVWKSLSGDLWESELPRWRLEFEVIAPFYIMRNLNALVASKMLCLESNGDYVAPEDHEEMDD